MPEIESHLNSYQSIRTKTKLLFEDVQLLLTELGFLHSGGRAAAKKDPSIDIHKERDLLDDLWMHIKGDYHANIQNLRTFIYGIMGLKYDWMLYKPESENVEHRENTHSNERISPAMKLLGSHYKEISKQAHGDSRHNHTKSDNGGKGFYTLNLFNTSPLRTSISTALQNFEHEKHNKHGVSPFQDMISTKLGDTVGTINSQGVFQFTKKVEIRKVNMHYKLLAENRANFVRKKKLDESALEDRTLKPKVDHK